MIQSDDSDNPRVKQGTFSETFGAGFGVVEELEMDTDGDRCQRAKKRMTTGNGSVAEYDVQCSYSVEEFDSIMDLETGEGLNSVCEKVSDNPRVRKVRVSESFDDDRYKGTKRRITTSDNSVEELGVRCNNSVEEYDSRCIQVVEELDVGSEKLGLSAGCSHSIQFGESVEEKKMELNLNIPCLEEEYEGSKIDFLKDGKRVVGCVNSDRKVEIIDLSTDESDDECEEICDPRGDRGKEKEMENGLTIEDGIGCLDLDFRREEIIGGKRFSKEEKGKGKVGESWLSLAPTNPFEVQLVESDVSMIQQEETWQQIDPLDVEFMESVVSWIQEDGNLQRTEMEEARAMMIQRENESRRNIENNSRRVQARRFAIFNSDTEDDVAQPHQEFDTETETPFSTAFTIIRERNLKQSAQSQIKWKPCYDEQNKTMPFVPSLLNLSLKVLAKNVDAIVSLELCPEALKQRLTDLLCDSREMNLHALGLLLEGSPTELRIKDCSWMTEEQFSNKFASFDSKSLKVLQLDLCGQCVPDDILCKTLARTSSSLPDLSIISLKGACRLSDTALKSLVTSAPLLCSINLSQCSLLTDAGIDILANSLGHILRELYIDDCNRIDAMMIATSLKKFKHLEVLSLSGIPSVCDRFLTDVIISRGRNMKALNLADCRKLTDLSLKVIGETCSCLRALDISNLDNMTDLGVKYLADGCRSMETLRLFCNGFSDEAIAAFLEVSGESLQELSLNNVSKVGCSTALSLAKCSRKLVSLDISWCRRITEDALGLIVDSCSSLKLLKLFGCTQITNVFYKGHTNPQVRIIGSNSTPVLEHINMLQPDQVLLRYSPLPFPFPSHDSQTILHQQKN